MTMSQSPLSWDDPSGKISVNPESTRSCNESLDQTHFIAGSWHAGSSLTTSDTLRQKEQQARNNGVGASKQEQEQK
jgi:hypothetical protein